MAFALAGAVQAGFCELLQVFPQHRLQRIHDGTSRIKRCIISAASAAATTTSDVVKPYKRPLWSVFELGKRPVYWESEDGRVPKSGGSLTIFFNPEASNLSPNEYYGVAFNGGFNQPIMCGGAPRVMTKKSRHADSSPLFSIKINVPEHALSLEFSFTDGKEWDGPYKLELDVPPKWRNKPRSFFDEGLASELSRLGACEDAIYPEAVFVKDRCKLPGYSEEALKCDLDLNTGCTDIENPFYDPLANVDDGSCPYVSEGEEQ